MFQQNMIVIGPAIWMLGLGIAMLRVTALCPKCKKNKRSRVRPIEKHSIEEPSIEEPSMFADNPFR